MGNRVALITGGARGIGRAIALDLAKQGWLVAICYRKSAQEGAEVVESVQKMGSKGLALQCDVSKPEAARQMVKQVEETWGRIDALINGAGPYHRVPLLQESIEGWHSMFDNNLHPVFYLSQAVISGMTERKWGRIISFSMANADQLIAQPQLTAHYIAKVGLLVFLTVLRRIPSRRVSTTPGARLRTNWQRWLSEFRPDMSAPLRMRFQSSVFLSPKKLAILMVLIFI